jgi:hypothetical protein
METVTDTTEQAQPPDNRKKRARFQETASDTPASQSPYGLAKLRANDTIASLPVTMQSLAKHYVFEYLKLKSSLARLEKIKFNLANDSFVPRSARINFAIGASPRAQEAYPTEFESLTERVEMAVGVFQTTCKDLIKTALDLEMKTVHDDLTSLFCRADIAIATSCAINSPTFDKSYGSLLVNSSFELNPEALLKHAGLLTRVQFFTALHKYTNAPGARVQFFTALHKYTNAPGAVHQLGDLLHADKAFIAPLCMCTRLSSLVCSYTLGMPSSKLPTTFKGLSKSKNSPNSLSDPPLPKIQLWTSKRLPPRVNLLKTPSLPRTRKTTKLSKL